MTLKDYQKSTLKDLADYLALLPQNSAGKAFEKFWHSRGEVLGLDSVDTIIISR